MMEQIKSKTRVRECGEVFTNEREVNAMVDLISPETKKIDSTFFEPACGNGNFLVEIYRRKLDTVEEQSGENSNNYEYLATRAISTIYGIDLQEDNIVEARERLFNGFLQAFKSAYNTIPTKLCQANIRFILSKNIQCGNSLTAKDLNNNPLLITQWKFDDEDGLIMQVFEFSEMISNVDSCTPKYTFPRIPYLLLPVIA